MIDSLLNRDGAARASIMFSMLLRLFSSEPKKSKGSGFLLRVELLFYPGDRPATAKVLVAAEDQWKGGLGSRSKAMACQPLPRFCKLLASPATTAGPGGLFLTVRFFYFPFVDRA